MEQIEDNPQYDALSYMWGDPSVTRQIYLDHDHAVPITVSLKNVLRHLRLRNKVRRLWVDAVCINQRDIKERGVQVGLMKEIYSRARTVRVWIDVDLPAETPAVQKLLTFYRRTTLDELGDDPEFWEPLVPLLQDPYWAGSGCNKN